MGSMFGGGGGVTTSPAAPTPPPRMPDPEDPGVVEAKRKAVQEALTRGGRASTILTGAGRRAASAAGGFDSYDQTKLG